MGKFWDYVMTQGDWEKMQRIQLYKAIKKKLDSGQELTAQEMIILNGGGE